LENFRTKKKKAGTLLPNCNFGWGLCTVVKTPKMSKNVLKIFCQMCRELSKITLCQVSRGLSHKFLSKFGQNRSGTVILKW
jgi:hypothetical protein